MVEIGLRIWIERIIPDKTRIRQTMKRGTDNMVRHLSQLSIRWLNVVSLTQPHTATHFLSWVARVLLQIRRLMASHLKAKNQAVMHTKAFRTTFSVSMTQVALTLSLLRIRKFINSSTANILQTLRTESCISHFHFRIVFEVVIIWLFRLLNSKYWVLPIVLR